MKSLPMLDQILKQLDEESQKLTNVNEILERLTAASATGTKLLNRHEQLGKELKQTATKVAAITESFEAKVAAMQALREEIDQLLARQHEKATALSKAQQQQLEQRLATSKADQERLLTEELKKKQGELLARWTQLLNQIERSQQEIGTSFRQETRQLQDALYNQVERTKHELGNQFEQRIQLVLQQQRRAFTLLIVLLVLLLGVGGVLGYMVFWG